MTDPKIVPAQKVFEKDKILIALKSKHPLILAALGCSLFIFAILILILFIFLVFNKKNTPQSNVWTGIVPGKNAPVSTTTSFTPIPTLKPTPTPRPLASGPQQYSVSSRNNPEVKELNISSLDTKIGDSQKMSLKIEGSQSPVVSVVAKLITDNKSENHPFTLSSGTNTNGVWEGTWITNDKHDIIYQVTFTVKYQIGNDYSFTPSFR